jgi:hypothetical protein
MSISVNAPRDSDLNTQKKWLGNYLGIVVQNNDPDKGGKIKVWVPEIYSVENKAWNEKHKDKAFKFIGRNIESDITDIIEELKTKLKWAICASPLTGAMAPGRYNAYEEKATISDSNRNATLYPDAWNGPLSLNDDGIGEKPAHKYEHHSFKVADAFSDKNEVRFNNVNKFSYSYVPTSYSNSAKGSFSVPNVGAHVWVFFIEGDSRRPVYFATTHSTDQWESIYNSELDYPGTYENKSLDADPNYNHNTETYRNKYVINQKGGTIEIVSTDNKESLKLTHYSGSFKEFNNNVNIEFATNNNQKLVRGDEFFTVNGTKNDYVGVDYDQIINGDYYKKIGNLNRDYQLEWRDLMESIADAKQLFEIQRAVAITDSNDFIKKTSGSQTKSGAPGVCPLCKSISPKDRVWDNKYIFTGVMQNAIYSSKVSSFNHVKDITSEFHKIPSELTIASSSEQFLGSTACPVCGGGGKSPSSYNGSWSPEAKDTLVIDSLRYKTQQLTEIEKKLGLGGSEIVNITKHKIENIGLVYNDFPSTRIDEVGKIENSEVQVFDKGVITTKKESALIEYVHIDDSPGGDFTQTIGNKWNVLVGSGGVSLKSTGGVDIGGTITNIAGQQVNVSSEYEVNISSKRVSIAAELLTLRNKNNKQILVDGNLGVSQNVVINGGLHVEGELSVHHITAPVEIQETEPVIVLGKLLSGLKFNVTASWDNKYHTKGSLILSSDSNDDHVRAYPHTHPFKNLPLKLMGTKDGVREQGKNTNEPFKISAFPVVHEKKGAEAI